MISVLTRKAVADVTRRKARTMLIIIGILIGVLGLTAVNAANELFGQEFLNNVAPIDEPDMAFSVQSLPTAVAAMIQARADVSIFETRLQFFSHWHLAGSKQTASIEVNGYQDWQHHQLYNFQLKSGRLPGRGEIVMDARARFLEPVAIGDDVTIDDAYGHAVPLRVVGLVHTDEYAQTDTIGYVSANGWQELVQLSTVPLHDVGGKETLPPGEQLLIRSKTHDAVSAEQTHRDIQEILDAAHIVTFTSSWSNPGGRSQIQLGISGLLTVVRVLAVVALVLVCLMILNTMTTLLAEQTKIIGTMKAIGGTRWRIIGSYLLSISIYGMVGTLLGIGLGLWLCSQLTNVISEVGKLDLAPYQVSVGVVLTSVLVGLLSPFIAALVPLWLGTRITVHQAMGGYGVSVGAGATKAHVVGSQFTFVPQTLWLGLRGIFRKPWLALLTLLALILSSSVFMAIQITSASITATLQHGNTVFHDDISLSLSDTPISGPPIIGSIQALPDVKRVEAIESQRATLKGRLIELIGLNADTQMYQPQLVAGRWLVHSDQNVLVVSDIVAQRLDLRVGEKVALFAGTEQADMMIVGIVHELYHAAALGDTSSQVGTTFTALSFLNTGLSHVPADSITGLNIQAKDTSTRALQQLEGRVQRVLVEARLRQAYISYVNINAAQRELSQVVIIYALFDTIACVVALVGLLSLSNTLAAAVLERRREIGILRSLGATGWRVGTVFGIEGLALGLIAWTVGSLAGFPGGYAIVNVLDYFLIPLELAVNPIGVLATLLFIVVVALIASFGPALSASRVRIQETLRYE